MSKYIPLEASCTMSWILNEVNVMKECSNFTSKYDIILKLNSCGSGLNLNVFKYRAGGLSSNVA